MIMFMQLQQPKTLEEAHALFIKNKMAPLLAGGGWLRLGKRRWPLVIDLSGLELNYIREEETEFAIGAMATQRQVETYEAFSTFCGGILPAAVRPILGVQFRNIATMGGSVASRYGFSDILPTLCALNAEVVLFEAGRMPIQDYLSFKGRDLLVEIVIPKREAPVAAEALRKSASDFPMLTGSIRKDGGVYSIYVGARPGIVMKAEQASVLLTERGASVAKEAAKLGAEEISFQTNSMCSAEYRRAMTYKMVLRLIEEVESWK